MGGGHAVCGRDAEARWWIRAVVRGELADARLDYLSPRVDYAFGRLTITVTVSEPSSALAKASALDVVSRAVAAGRDLHVQSGSDLGPVE